MSPASWSTPWPGANSSRDSASVSVKCRVPDACDALNDLQLLRAPPHKQQGAYIPSCCLPCCSRCRPVITTPTLRRTANQNTASTHLHSLRACLCSSRQSAATGSRTHTQAPDLPTPCEPAPHCPERPCCCMRCCSRCASWPVKSPTMQSSTHPHYI
jgi:hypothetical protein